MDFLLNKICIFSCCKPAHKILHCFGADLLLIFIFFIFYPLRCEWEKAKSAIKSTESVSANFGLLALGYNPHQLVWIYSIKAANSFCNSAVKKNN